MIQILSSARRDPYPAALLASAVSIALHIGTWLTWQAAPAEITPVQTPPQVIEVALMAPAAKQPPAAAPKPETPPEQAQQQKTAPKKPEKPKPKAKPKPSSKPAQKLVPPPVPAPPDNTGTSADSASKPTDTAPTKVAAKPSAPASLVKAVYSSPSLNNPPTHYPRIAQVRQWEGTVILEIRVLANGSAGNVKIARSSGHEVLDDSAVEQVKTWRFIPARQGDKTVDDWVRVPITFKFKH